MGNPRRLPHAIFGSIPPIRISRAPVRGRRLPYFHILDISSHMKTTLNIDDTVMRRLRQESARQGRTMSEMVETALRLLLRSPAEQRSLPSLPRFRSGGTLVDVADRDALYEAMEDR